MISPPCGAILIVCGSSNEKKTFPAALAVVLTAHEQQNYAKEEYNDNNGEFETNILVC